MSKAAADTPNIALAKANGAKDMVDKSGKHNGRAVEQDLVTTISAAVQEPTTVTQPTRHRVRIQVRLRQLKGYRPICPRITDPWQRGAAKSCQGKKWKNT